MTLNPSHLTCPYIKKKSRFCNLTKQILSCFGIPVYSGRVPETFLSYFETLKGNNTPAALIATYGCRAYEDALLELKTEVENRGFHVIGAGAFPTEHSIVRSIGLSRPNKADLKTISEFGIALNRRIKNEDLSALSIQVPGNTPYPNTQKTPLIPKADVKPVHGM